jgi:hypothetical protein
LKSKSRDIIFLLGAGASAEANIPVSATMISKIEELLAQRQDWKPFLPLYNHVKSAVYYSAGLRGIFRDDVNYNIEILANTLFELARNEQHPIYPFVATWNSRFLGLAGPDFAHVESFREKILNQLKDWVQMENPKKADYYKDFRRLQQALQFPLKIFSLNYDLCVERIADDSFRVETGFGGYGEEHHWQWRRFDEALLETDPPEIYLYKLHGSINWKRDDAGNLVSVDHAGSNIPASAMQVIFGRDFKLEAGDPYLFYAFEFRRCTLEARVIVVIGYSFSDDHINKMLAQALRHDDQKQVVVIDQAKDQVSASNHAANIAKRLNVSNTRVVVLQGSAKAFLESQDLASTVLSFLPTIPSVEF